MSKSLFFRGGEGSSSPSPSPSSPAPCPGGPCAHSMPPTGAAATTGAAAADSGECASHNHRTSALSRLWGGGGDGCGCLPSSDPNPNGKGRLPAPLRYWWARLERAAGGPKRLRALLLAYAGLKLLFGLAVLYWTYSKHDGGGGGDGGDTSNTSTSTSTSNDTTTPLPYRLAGQGAKATGLAVGVISGSGLAQTRRVRLLQETWATSLDPSIDALLVFSDATDPRLPSVGVKGTGSTWAGAQDRFLPALSFLHRAFPNASWYVLVDDDTFVVPRNLRAALARRDPAEAWYVGRTMFVKDGGAGGTKARGEEREEKEGGSGGKGNEETASSKPSRPQQQPPPASKPPPQKQQQAPLVPFAHGGSGVCLSRGLMARFGPHLHQEAAAPTAVCRARTGYGDGDLAVCLRHYVGVKPTHEPCLHSGGPWATEAEAALDGALLGGGDGGGEGDAGAGPAVSPCSFHQILRRQGDESQGAGRADGGEDEQVRTWHREFNLGEGGGGGKGRGKGGN